MGLVVTTDRYVLQVAGPGVNATLAVVNKSLQLVTVGTQGPPGPQGDQGPPGGSTVSRNAGEAISGHRAVAIRNDGLVYYVSPADPEADYVFGITNNAAAQGDALAIVISGEVIEPSWNWTVGSVWLGVNGTLTQVVPTSGSLVRVGTAVAPTSLFVEPRLIARL
jgi:hypothetical protein